jgi:hypothetical protein
VNFAAACLPGFAVFDPWLPEGDTCYKLSPSMPFRAYYADVGGGLSSAVSIQWSVPKAVEPEQRPEKQ